MQLRDTLIDISNDARSWLEAWARDFTDAGEHRTAPTSPRSFCTTPCV